MALLVSLTGLFKSHSISLETIGAALVAAFEVTYRAFVPAADPKSAQVNTDVVVPDHELG